MEISQKIGIVLLSFLISSFILKAFSDNSSDYSISIMFWSSLFALSIYLIL